MNERTQQPVETAQAPYTVVIVQDGDRARLSCATLEEAIMVKRSFVNYGRYQEVSIEHCARTA